MFVDRIMLFADDENVVCTFEENNKQCTLMNSDMTGFDRRETWTRVKAEGQTISKDNTLSSGRLDTRTA